MAGKGCGRARGAVHPLFTVPLGLPPPSRAPQRRWLGGEAPRGGPGECAGCRCPGATVPAGWAAPPREADLGGREEIQAEGMNLKPREKGHTEGGNTDLRARLVLI